MVCASYQKRFLILCLFLLTPPLLCAQEETKNLERVSSGKNISEPAEEIQPAADKQGPAPLKERIAAFLSWINSKAYASTVDKAAQKQRLREEWKKALGGMDIFYPHDKAKATEEWIKKKASVKIFNMKGRPEFKKNEIKYIFKMKF